VGLLWARFIGKRFPLIPEKLDVKPAEEETQPATWLAFAPILIPVILIALKSVADYPAAPFGSGSARQIIAFIGHPVIALIIGVFIAFGLKTRRTKGSQFEWVMEGLKNAGVIILITGAGGAFGHILRATGIGEMLGQIMAEWKLGIFLPFVIAAVLKTAQGSSTVAIITTAALVSPLIEPLGFVSPVSKALIVLSIGAGSMTVSHLNDSYFWVVSQFSGMDTSTALRSHTLATLFQGLAAIVTIAALSLLLA
jgi:GntP family gluconate:H+ symporter